MPLVVATGGNSPFEKLMPSIAASLRAHGCAKVKIEVIKNSAHYLVEEQPDAVAELIERYGSGGGCSLLSIAAFIRRMMTC